MALIPNIIDTGAGESIQSMYDKLNSLIDTFNDVLGGGTTGQTIRKINGTDFNFEFVRSLKWTTVDIGDWDMSSLSNIAVAHGVTDGNKIRVVDVMIRDDSGSIIPLLQVDAATGIAQGGYNVSSLGAGFISLRRTEGGYFDSLTYDEIAYNRGFITIGYVD